ncbi:DinB family protein [Acidothermaceae bacterium B102]|nr:DinB family protein [Acidothermaceae bacterium B102]
MQDQFSAVTDERSGLLVFLEQQRQALRASIRGLTEFQAHQIPSASTLSLATLLFHVIRVERRWTEVVIAGCPVPDIWPLPDPAADFRLPPGLRVPDLLDAYSTAAAGTHRVVAGVLDLGQPCADEESSHLSVRWVLLHLIEETARHAGHADIIRESIDGASATMLRGG